MEHQHSSVDTDTLHTKRVDITLTWVAVDQVFM